MKFTNSALPALFSNWMFIFIAPDRESSAHFRYITKRFLQQIHVYTHIVPLTHIEYYVFEIHIYKEILEISV